MRAQRILINWSIVALLGLAVGVASAALEPLPGDLPVINYLRMDRDYQGQWVIHWAGWVDPEAGGSFILHGPGPAAICSGIGQATACDCRWDPYGADFWAGCSFKTTGQFAIPGWPGQCLVDLWWLDGDQVYELKTWIGRCNYPVLLPLVMSGG